MKNKLANFTSITSTACVRGGLLAAGVLAACLVTAGLPPESQKEPEPPQPPKNAAPTALEKMHAEQLHHFATAPGFGMSRMVRIPRHVQITLAGVTYSVIRPDLIALETKAVAYRNPGEDGVSMATLTNRTARARLQTRPITGEESRAILELRDGTDIVQQAVKVLSHQGPARTPVETTVVRVVGALRATASCARCHEVPQGTLLGAFSYSLVPASPASQLEFYGVLPGARAVRP